MRYPSLEDCMGIQQLTNDRCSRQRECVDQEHKNHGTSGELQVFGMFGASWCYTLECWKVRPEKSSKARETLQVILKDFDCNRKEMGKY